MFSIDILPGAYVTTSQKRDRRKGGIQYNELYPICSSVMSEEPILT